MKTKCILAFLLGTIFGMGITYFSIPKSRRKLSKKSNEEENDDFLDDEFFDEDIAQEFEKEEKEEEEEKEKDSPHVTMGEVLYQFLMK